MVTRSTKTMLCTPAVHHVVDVYAWLGRAWFARVANSGMAPEAGFMR